MKINILKAYRILTKDKRDMALICTYHNRIEKHSFDSSSFGMAQYYKYISFKHMINCIKHDFRGISTHYGGNKSDCKFKWVLKSKLPA